MGLSHQILPNRISIQKSLSLNSSGRYNFNLLLLKFKIQV